MKKLLIIPFTLLSAFCFSQAKVDTIMSKNAKWAQVYNKDSIDGLVIKKQFSIIQPGYLAVRSVYADSFYIGNPVSSVPSTNVGSIKLNGNIYEVKSGSYMMGGWLNNGGLVIPQRAALLTPSGTNNSMFYYYNGRLYYARPVFFDTKTMAYLDDVQQPLLYRLNLARGTTFISSTDFASQWFKVSPGESHVLSDTGITMKGNANNYLNYVRNNWTSGAQNYTSKSQFQVYYSGTSIDSGISLGSYSTQLIARDISVKFSYGTKKLYIVMNNSTVLDSSVAIAYTPADIFDLYLVRNANTISAWLYNRNTYKSVTVTHTAKFKYPSPENLNNFGYAQIFYHFGGHTRLISLNYELNDRKECDLWWYGDSNSEYLYNALQSRTAFNLLARSSLLYCVNYSGGGNAVLTNGASIPDYNLYKPKYVVLALGTNNAINGDDSTTFRTKLNNTITYLTNTANNADLIKIIMLTVPPMTGTNVSMYNNTIYSLLSTNAKVQIVDRFNLLKDPSSNDLATKYDAGDGIHYNADAHRAVYGAVVASFPATVSNNYSVQDGTDLELQTVPEYNDNAAAISGGLKVGEKYRTGDALKIVH
jgi:lysophospholipase L1-like esterase